jgi:hypothetical protein
VAISVNHPEYQIARLKRDHPELIEKVEAGEMTRLEAAKAGKRAWLLENSIYNI